MINTDEQYKYFAFISYNSKDWKWGRTLQRKLENYTLSKEICKKHGLKRTPMRPIFFAPSDIQSGGLNAELEKRLQASRNLIVICSPNSAKSTWVGKEIEFFHKLGRTDNIHFFIVDGIPNSGNPDTECYNPILKELDIPEILGANIHEANVSPWPWIRKERAYVQLITKLLGIEFDTIWKRHQRQLAESFGWWFAGIAAILAIIFYVWYSTLPVDINVKLNEASYVNNQLPPMTNAVLSITLDNETKTDTVKDIATGTLFKNIPSRLIGTEVNFKVKCQDFNDVDTTILLAPEITINIYRDASVYGNVHFRLWDVARERALSNTTVEIDGVEAVSDENGNVSVYIPIEKQKSHYSLKTSFSDDVYTIYMPCGDYNAILIE